jgi:hypothetical protein
MPKLIYRKPLLGPKSQGKGGRNGNKFVLKVGCDTKINFFVKTRFISKVMFEHSSDIRNTSIFLRCSKRSIFKY